MDECRSCKLLEAKQRKAAGEILKLKGEIGNYQDIIEGKEPLKVQVEKGGNIISLILLFSHKPMR